MSTLINIIQKNDVLWVYALNRKFSCQVLDTIMKIITLLGTTTSSIIISLSLMLYNVHMGFVLVINLLISQSIVHFIKRVVDRPRPYKTLDWAIAINPPKCKYSFPSGHSSTALTIALVMSSFFPVLKMPILIMSLLIGISRIYMGVHYPTDVSLGFVISYIVYELLVIIVIF